MPSFWVPEERLRSEDQGLLLPPWVSLGASVPSLCDSGLSLVVCSKDKEQDKLKGQILLEQRVTALLSLCHSVTTAMSQSPPKQHALSLSHPI